MGKIELLLDIVSIFLYLKGVNYRDKWFHSNIKDFGSNDFYFKEKQFFTIFTIDWLLFCMFLHLWIVNALECNENKCLKNKRLWLIVFQSPYLQMGGFPEVFLDFSYLELIFYFTVILLAFHQKSVVSHTLQNYMVRQIKQLLAEICFSLSLSVQEWRDPTSIILTPPGAYGMQQNNLY